jgi:hypothetical protein
MHVFFSNYAVFYLIVLEKCRAPIFKAMLQCSLQVLNLARCIYIFFTFFHVAGKNVFENYFFLKDFFSFLSYISGLL